jgi:hypothetical protein
MDDTEDILLKDSLLNDSLLEKVNIAKKTGNLNREIDTCIDQIMLGDAGELQYFYASNKTYCSKSEAYCPLQIKKDSPGLKECIGSELYLELISNKYK